MRKVYKQMDNHQLCKFMQAGGVLVDIRRAEEWRLTGIVEGSVLLTFFTADGSSNPENWLKQLNALVPAEKSIALICRSGYRTGLICEYLIEVCSRPEVFNLTEGILGWLANEYPVVAPGEDP